MSVLFSLVFCRLSPFADFAGTMSLKMSLAAGVFPDPLVEACIEGWRNPEQDAMRSALHTSVNGLDRNPQ
jgi:hypothetical protein